MSDNKRETDEINWAEFQKKYFDALTSFNSANSSFEKPNPFAHSIWNNAMEDWWKSMKMKSGTSYENQNLFEKVIEQCRNYYFMSEQFSSLIEGISKFENNKNDVTDFINNKFEELQSMFSKAQDNDSWNKFLGEMNWADFQKRYFDLDENPFDNMNSQLSGNILNFANIYESLNPEMKKIRNQLLSVPNVGQNREIQDKLQKLIKLGIVYQDYNNEHQLVMAALSQEALELMRKKILSMSKKGDDFTSMRQIYDLWIESNEKVYGDYVLTKEYSELNGKLVNSQMAFMKLGQEVNEDVLTALNLPTTRAMNDLERRHYELRKKVKELESELQVLKGKTVKQAKVVKEKTTIVKDKAVSTRSNSTKKKKTTKKKVSKKKAEKKVALPKKKKPVRKAAKQGKKKTTTRRRSSPVKSDVIEIKF
jgi:class III poly(R)-hydroxyalkanoic acid synthase PhaE subunit